jgi:hypothetical protein
MGFQFAEIELLSSDCAGYSTHPKFDRYGSSKTMGLAGDYSTTPTVIRWWFRFVFQRQES